MRRPSRALAFCLFLLAACGESDTILNDSDGEPEIEPDGENLTRFEVYTTEGDGSERLRWVGNGYGPEPSSPEQTQQPWVGYGRKFRVNFVMKSLETAVQGYQIVFGECENDCEYWPADPFGTPIFEAPRDWIFDPQRALDEVPSDCLEDPECVTGVFLPSGELSFSIRAIDELENVITRDAARLGIQVNYPPTIELQDDGGGICDDDQVFPHYVLEPYGGGPPTLCSIAPGDTIPVGAVVHMKLDGRDRLEGTSPDGSLCCDERADTSIPEMRYQGRLEFLPQHDRGYVEELSVFFSPLDDASEHVFLAGPFDYSYIGRGRDEHGRPAESDVRFDFVAGYPPRLTQIEPAQGTRIVLRDPADGMPWPDNEFDYTESTGQVRYWDLDGGRFLLTPTSNSIAISGTVFALGPVWRGVADPRSPQPAIDGAAPQYSGGVLSWAYEWYSSNDPQNLLGDGPGSDDLALFNASPSPNEWDTTAGGGFQIFVPDLIWDSPQLFDCQDATPFCDMAVALRARLGEIHLMVRGRSTAETGKFTQCSPGEAEIDNCVEFSLQRRGRYTEVAQRSFFWQLGLDPDGDQAYDAWPPIAVPKTAALDAAALRSRIATPRR